MWVYVGGKAGLCVGFVFYLTTSPTEEEKAGVARRESEVSLWCLDRVFEDVINASLEFLPKDRRGRGRKGSSWRWTPRNLLL